MSAETSLPGSHSAVFSVRPHRAEGSFSTPNVKAKCSDPAQTSDAELSLLLAVLLTVSLFLGPFLPPRLCLCLWVLSRLRTSSFLSLCVPVRLSFSVSLLLSGRLHRCRLLSPILGLCVALVTFSLIRCLCLCFPLLRLALSLLRCFSVSVSPRPAPFVSLTFFLSVSLPAI